MKKLITILPLLVFGILIIFFLNYDYIFLERRGSYRFVIEGDKDNIYEKLLYVKKIKGEKEVRNLLVTFLDKKNRDLLSKHLAIAYVSRNNMKEFLPYLKLVQEDFESMKFNSDTIIEIYPGRLRRSELKRGAYIIELLDNAIKALVDTSSVSSASGAGMR